MQMKKDSPVKLIFVISFSVFILVQACDDTLNTQNEIIIPSQNVSYNKYIQPLFNIKCTNSGCHNDESKAEGLSLTTWSNTRADPAIVFPYEPQSSKLVWAIEGEGISIMPPFGYPPLTENQREGIKIWIKEGAENN